MEASAQNTDHASPVRILHTKLFIPRTHPDVVPRTWLDQKLEDGLKSQLMILSAPAGSGKTTLLSRWITRTGRPVAWLSLDERDNDFTRFWSYFIAALQTIRAETGRTALQMLRAPQPPPTEALLTELINDISAMEDDFLLVLDDYHSIDDSSIHEGISNFITNIPPQMHLIIAGRSRPPLPLPLLRGRRDLFELQAADLRFSKEEIASFLNQIMKLGLTADHIDAIEKLTEGWAAGIQLAAMALEAIRKDSRVPHASQPDELTTFLSAFSGSHHYVFDYLAQEVFEHQPKQIQTFLLHTAILDRLCSPLCSALDPDQAQGEMTNQAILEQLEAANLFIVPLDPHRRWYRYHPLFASFLQARLQKEYSQENIAKLHRLACEWLETNGYLHEAIPHALAAQDFDLSVALINQVTEEMFLTSQLTTFKSWLAGLPQKLISQNIQLSMKSAWSKLATGEMDQVEPHLTDVEKLLGFRADGSEASMELSYEQRAILAEISSIRATLNFNQLNLQMVLDLCRQGRAYISAGESTEPSEKRADVLGVLAFNQAIACEFSGDTLAAEQAFIESNQLNRHNPHLLSMGIGHLAGLQILKGQLHRAENYFLEALRSSQPSRTPSPLSAIASTGLGNLLCEWNRLDQALPHLQRGIELGRQWNQWESLLSGYTGLARLHWAYGERQAAFARLDELMRRAQDLDVLWMTPPIQAYHALLSARNGDFEIAQAWVKNSSITQGSDIHFLLEPDALTLTRIHLIENQFEQAAWLAGETAKSAQAGGRLGRWTEAILLHGLALYLQGKIPQALPLLEKPLQRAVAEDYRRIFLDEGQRMADFLQQAQIDGPRSSPGWDSGLNQFIDELLTFFETSPTTSRPSPARNAKIEAQPAQSELVDFTYQPLSERELEVMGLIAAGLTNQQISDHLYISLNTVKTHVKNIYQRLEVTNRAQAIARSRQLGLL
jgi:LuxR family transcriptional regulator, maltose regulon positive regulatory protein